MLAMLQETFRNRVARRTPRRRHSRILPRLPAGAAEAVPGNETVDQKSRKDSENGSGRLLFDCLVLTPHYDNRQNDDSKDPRYHSNYHYTFHCFLSVSFSVFYRNCGFTVHNRAT